MRMGRLTTVRNIVIVRDEVESIQPIKEEPAIFVNPGFLVIGDLHIGAIISKDFAFHRTFVENLIERVKKLRDLVKAHKLILTGDIKERIGPLKSRVEREMIELFLREVLKIFDKIFIVKGNHDGRIEEILLEKEYASKVVIAKSVLIQPRKSARPIIITHGHMKLDKGLFEKYRKGLIVISSHMHPAVSIAPGIKVKVWAIFDIEFLKRKYKWIIMPAFSEIIVGSDLRALPKNEILARSPFPSLQAKILNRSFLLLDLTPIMD